MRILINQDEVPAVQDRIREELAKGSSQITMTLTMDARDAKRVLDYSGTETMVLVWPSVRI